MTTQEPTGVVTAAGRPSDAPESGDTDTEVERAYSAARDYLDGKLEPERHPGDLVKLCGVLLRQEPVVAGQLARELASRFLQRKPAKRPQERATPSSDPPWQAIDVDKLWGACQRVEAFGFARRILQRRIESRDHIVNDSYPNAPTLSRLRQQRALCTSKDPDLSASMRHDWALDLLSEDAEGQGTSEHEGIAGGILKRRWEWDGSRATLELSLERYRRGIPPQPEKKDAAKPPARVFSSAGYVEINCAFVLDLLASLTREPATQQHYRDEADELRRELEELKTQDLWSWATKAEARVGLDQMAEAELAMKEYLERNPASWEIETTLRQLVRLAYLRGFEPSKIEPVLKVVPSFGSDAARQSLLVGRVGLALSGGGFRASLYHLGVLARLAESDLLRHVEVLSCVSGGSIVGAHYYLRLRQRLQEKALERTDYVEIVRASIDDFVKGVARNVRTRILAEFRNSYAIVSGDDIRYARCVGQLFHETFYAHLDREGSRLEELLIQPKDAPHNFHPGRHNWTRRNKVPVLILNAATLNTGHSWQFTARSMGESPFSMLPQVDSNPRLRRPNYLGRRSVYLRDAVAASACVPGLFAPMQLDGLYPSYKVRLVDGGVYDNQGTTSLVEQDCQVLLVSDAAGQLFSEETQEGGHISPLRRSVSVFQERIRQSGYDNLMKRKDAGQLRGIAYTHLTQGLQAPAVNWVDCEDPLLRDEQLRDVPRSGNGVDEKIQRHLAKMRTDLDVFSEIECASLMASGYLSMSSQLDALLKDVPALRHERNVEDWFFGPVIPLLSGRQRDSSGFKLLEAHLLAASSGLGRSLKLNRAVRNWCIALAVLVAAGAIPLVIRFWNHSLATVGSVVALLAGLVLPLYIGKWIVNVIDPHSVWKNPLRKVLLAVPLTLFAKLVVGRLDRAYLRDGSLERFGLRLDRSGQ